MIKRAPLELPPEVARRFFHGERNPVKRDEIAARQLHALAGSVISVGLTALDFARH